MNEAYVIVGDLGFETAGPVTKITEVIGTDRLRVGSEHGMQSVVLQRSAELMKAPLKAGDEVRVDASYRMALEVLGATGIARTLSRRPCRSCRGKKSAARRKRCRRSRTRSSCRSCTKNCSRNFSTPRRKDFCSTARPVAARRSSAKATAYNLTKQLREKSGEEMKEYFMHVKGPEILNMWVGESERIVREIFATAREKRREGFMPFLFIDEAESILGTRRASRYSNILSTLVPMFCSEMDGIDSLHEVVIILASNRADLIDPAILRPGRIDRKIKVNRPNKEGAREIYRIYLTHDLPYDGALAKEADNIGEALDRLIDRFLEWQFAHREENKFLEVTLRSGRKETLYRERLAQRRDHRFDRRARQSASRSSAPSPRNRKKAFSENDLQLSFIAEFTENEIFPPTDITEDWLKLIDYDPENVVKIAPVRALKAARTPSGVI